MRHLFRPALIGLAFVVGTVVWAQRFRGGDITNPRSFQDSVPTPEWKNEPGFEKDVFTFVRIRYGSAYGRSGRSGRWGRRGGGPWNTDYPDAELNLSYRLQQMTSMKVDPNGKVMEIMDPELFRYPFIYIVEPGNLTLTEEELPILRRYLLHGGFLMIDDFWGDDEWENLESEMKRVFPDRGIVDIPRTHPIFRSVFDIPNDLNLQLPSIGYGMRGGADGITWETGKRYDTDTDAHFRGIFDDKGRLCVFICHNTDNGDGWEREGENEYYFREFSEKKAYPLGINVIFYAMTH